MHTLNNGRVEVAFDERANLVSLRNLATGREWAGSGALWRIIFEHGIVQEEEALAERARNISVMRENDSLRIRYSGIETDAGTFDFRVEAAVRLDGEEVCFDAKLENRTPAATLREFQFPLVKNLKLGRGTELLTGQVCDGYRYPDIPARLEASRTGYMGQDNKALEFSCLYPGLVAVNCYFLAEPENTLAVMSFDPTFQNTLHLLRKRRSEIDAGLVKYPFLRPGESVSITGYRLAPVSGDWHRAADHYRKWCESWMAKPEKPESILNSNGWHRLIMRHQYGKQLFHYRDLPKILKSGLEAGIDTLFMFGWHAGGHDSCYPEYDFAEDEGGHDELKKQIAAFQANGGHVILYYNGQLIDTATRFYETVGKRISVKLSSGREHMEVYPFGGDGTALRQFGNKVFVTACPGTEEWLDVLKGLADKAIELGCDGVFFDQLGYISRPCCDPSHGHRVPFMDVTAAKAEMVRKLRGHVKSRRPEMSFGIEWFNDVTAQHVDFLHNIYSDGSPYHYPELVRYLFPETTITDRCIRDDTDIEPRVNRAVRLGLRSDVEIYRCRALIDETPHYKAYLTKANAFRDRNRALILNGRFRDTLGAVCDNPAVDCSVFEAPGRTGVILCSGREAAKGVVTVPGARFRRFDRIAEGEAAALQPDKAGFELPPDSLLLLEFER
ncbi:MAG: hypothetical protein HPZ91_17435 [Lentisphaeria bacterium]|nr:hypothetical protein [Lentisphaeria bacterium]